MTMMWCGGRCAAEDEPTGTGHREGLSAQQALHDVSNCHPLNFSSDEFIRRHDLCPGYIISS